MWPPKSIYICESIVGPQSPVRPLRSTHMAISHGFAPSSSSSSSSLFTIPSLSLSKPEGGNPSSFPLCDFSEFRSEFEKMSESSSRIGLKWEPNLPSFGFSGTKTSTTTTASSSKNTLSKPELVDGLFVPPNDPKKLNKLAKKQLKDTAGKSWFDMPAPTITPEIKKDLQLLKLRTVLDPKRHYKKGDKKSKALPKYFQVGTVIESASDFFSGRLTKKQRKSTLAEELLSDQHLGSYRKRKVQEIEKQYNVGGVEKWKNKGRQSYKRAKQRRN